MDTDFQMMRFYSDCPPGWEQLGDGRCWRDTWMDGGFYCPPGWMPHDDGESCYRDVEWLVTCPEGWYASEDYQSCRKDGWAAGDACPDGWILSGDGMACFMAAQGGGGSSADGGWNLESCSGDYCAGYRGYQARTVGGLECIDWAASSMTPEAYPDFGLQANYCRNPDASNTIWCYTSDPDVTWDYCEPIVMETVECPAGWTRTEDG